MGFTEEEELNTPKKVKKTSVRMNREPYTKSWVQLVTAHGMPLRTLDYLLMPALLDPYEENFNMPALTSCTIKPILREKSKAIRTIIKNKV